MLIHSISYRAERAAMGLDHLPLRLCMFWELLTASDTIARSSALGKRGEPFSTNHLRTSAIFSVSPVVQSREVEPWQERRGRTAETDAVLGWSST